MGVISWIAAALITVLAFAVLRFMNLETKMQRKMSEALKGVDMSQVENPLADKKNRWAIFTLSFVAVFREGVETVVFIAGVGSNTEATAIPIPALLGIALGCAFGAFVFYSGKTVKDLRWFFYASATVILFVGAGQVSIGTYNFQRAERFGKFATFRSRRPWYNRPAWNISACCSDLDSGNAFFALIRALFGYQDKPTPLEIMLYLLYWVCVGGMFAYKARKGSLLDADWKFKRKLREQGMDPETFAAANALEGGEGKEGFEGSVVVAAAAEGAGKGTDKGAGKGVSVAAVGPLPGAVTEGEASGSDSGRASPPGGRQSEIAAA